MVAGPVYKDLDIYLIPLKEKIVLGGSYEFGIDSAEVDASYINAIMEYAKVFFSQELLNAKPPSIQGWFCRNMLIYSRRQEFPLQLLQCYHS